MTLGEFRRITKHLSDYAEFVTKEGESAEYIVDLELSHFRLHGSGKMIPVEESVCLIPLVRRTKSEGADGDGQAD